MTFKEIQEQEEKNWARVPERQRYNCVLYLRTVLPPDFAGECKEAFEKESFPTGFHMFQGMYIRNLLRAKISDEDLPPVKYPGGREYTNWDDFYMGALRQAVLPKPDEF